MPKKSLVTGESANLYDPDTGAYVGVVDKAGKEIDSVRVIGFQDAEAFLKTLGRTG